MKIKDRKNMSDFKDESTNENELEDEDFPEEIMFFMVHEDDNGPKQISLIKTDKQYSLSINHVNSSKYAWSDLALSELEALSEAISNLVKSEKDLKDISEKPTAETLLLTSTFEKKLNVVMYKVGVVLTPLKNVSNQREVVYEFWFKDKKLSFYINDVIIEYIKITDVNNMENGQIASNNDIENIWRWLIDTEGLPTKKESLCGENNE